MNKISKVLFILQGISLTGLFLSVESIPTGIGTSIGFFLPTIIGVILVLKERKK